MKKIYSVLMFIIISSFAIKSQNYTKEYGKIAKDEIELTKYASDPDAEAVVLFDLGKSSFILNDAGLELLYERTTRIKILSDAGIKYAEVEIPFYQEGEIFEKVFDIEATTYNYENAIINRTQFKPANTYDEKKNQYWKVKKFALPDVRKGSIIEYRYKIISQYLFNLRDWEFQWRIPVVYSEYEVGMVPFYEYSWLLQGANKFDFQSSKVSDGLPRQYGPVKFSDMVHKYGMKNIPAFNSEEFISSINDYIMKIDFQLSKVNRLDGTSENILSTWDELIKDMLKDKDFGKYIAKSEKLAPKIIDVAGYLSKTEEEKFNYVIDYMKANYSWDKMDRKYAGKSPSKFIDEKRGSCADINLFAIGLLHSLGIEAYPVIISTRDNGKIKHKYPYLPAFDYVLILSKINGNRILSDATDVANLNNRIPPRCINDKGLIIKEGPVEWIGLETLFASEKTTETEISLNDSVLTAAIKKTCLEYDALDYRKKYSDNKDEVKKVIEDKDLVANDSSIFIENVTDKNKPYILSYKLTGKPELINDKIYIKPFLNEPLNANPLKQKTRTYPIDMIYPVKRTFKSTIIIPEGFQTDYLPSNRKISNNLFDLEYSLDVADKKINITMTYSFKNSVYQPLDYIVIKSYFNEIIDKGNDKIVFSRIKTTSNN